MNTRKTTYEEQKALQYLNELEDVLKVKATSLYVQHLQKKFPKMSKNSARELMLLWDENYNEDGNYETVKLI